MRAHTIPGPPSTTESDETAALVVEACEEVHRRLGPGLFVGAYLDALSHELSLRGASFHRKVDVPVFYRGVRLDAAHRVDLCVRGHVAVDVRAVDAILAVHRAELRAKLRVSGLDGGVLVNFRTARFGEGLVILRRSALRGRQQAAAQLALLHVDTSVGGPPTTSQPR